MSSRDDGTWRGVAAPSGKLTRFARFGGMAGSVAGGVAFDRDAETTDLSADPAAGREIIRPTAAMLDQRMTRADRRLTGFAIGR